MLSHRFLLSLRAGDAQAYHKLGLIAIHRV
jgi:hypothetical protein